jgi:hypothetical protein
MGGIAEPGKVIGLTQRSGYRPDLAALARNHVIIAREQLGITVEDFASRLTPLLGWSPTPEVVRSWETQVTPPGDVILAVGLLTQDRPRDIVPVPLTENAGRLVDLMSSVIGDLERTASSPDVVRIYPTRGLIARQEWNDFIDGVTGPIWLYGMAEMGYAVDDQVPGILSAAADRGCEIRVLLLDPAFPAIEDIDLDEGNPPGTLAPRIRAALARFQLMADACGAPMRVRLYNATPTVSIVRADAKMLVTPYMRFFTGGNSPTLELREYGGNVFERYARHFEHMWQQARETA